MLQRMTQFHLTQYLPDNPHLPISTEHKSRLQPTGKVISFAGILS